MNAAFCAMTTKASVNAVKIDCIISGAISVNLFKTTKRTLTNASIMSGNFSASFPIIATTTLKNALTIASALSTIKLNTSSMTLLIVVISTGKFFVIAEIKSFTRFKAICAKIGIEPRSLLKNSIRPSIIALKLSNISDGLKSIMKLNTSENISQAFSNASATSSTKSLTAPVALCTA